MMDKRISLSKKIARCSEGSRNLWFMVYPHVDRDGRIAFDDLEDLKTEVMPYFEWTIQRIAIYLNELADIGLINLYPSKGKIAIEMVRFEDFQKGLHREREAPSEVEAYGATPENSGIFRINPEKSPLSLSLSLRKEGRKKDIVVVGRIDFDMNTGTFLNIAERDIEIWKKAYPACNIKLCLSQMAAWLMANPTKLKKNYKRFIVNWLTREQQRGGSRAPETPVGDDWAAKKTAEMENKNAPKAKT